MATPGAPGPQQRFNNIITRISFAAGGGGLVYFHFQWGATSDKVIPSNVDPMFDFKNSFIDLPNIHMLADQPVLSVPKTLSADEKKKTVRIDTPVTSDMIRHFAAWTPADAMPFYRAATTLNFPGIDVYEIDTASWVLVFNHIITGRQTPWNFTRDQAIEEFKRTTVDPTLVGVQLIQYYDGHAFVDMPELPDPFTVSQFAINGGTWHVETSPSTVLTEVKGGVNLILSLGTLRQAVSKVHQKDKTVTFNIVVPANPDCDSFEMMAQAMPLLKGNPQHTFDARTKKDLWQFPVDVKQVPTWSDWTSKKQTTGEVAQPRKDRVIKVTIDWATKDNKGKDVDPVVTLEIDSETRHDVG